jgi:hypothetical protein
MPATESRNAADLNNQIEHMQAAASKLITRLADRAAYASGQEYEEIRDLMTALRQLGGSPKISV